MRKYATTIKRAADLSDGIKQDLVNLYLNHYDSSDRARVLEDLSSKREVIILYYQGKIVGFTTLQVFEHEFQTRKIRVLFSGDTIVDRAHWGQQSLAFAWISHLAQIKSECPDLPFYWLVTIKGHRTFKYLPTFGKSFYPHWSMDRSDLKPLLDSLAGEKFGALYNPLRGTVEYDQSHGQLKKEFAYPGEQELKKESVRFFLSKNPNYLFGDELVCLCELEEENMKPLTKRIFCKAYYGNRMAESA